MATHLLSRTLDSPASHVAATVFHACMFLRVHPLVDARSCWIRVSSTVPHLRCSCSVGPSSRVSCARLPFFLSRRSWERFSDQPPDLSSRGSAPPSTSSLSTRLTLFEREPFSRPFGSRVPENLLSFGFAFLSPLGLTRGIGEILRVSSFQAFPFERKKRLPRGSDFGGISVARVLRVLRSTAASKARTRRNQWMIGPPRGQIDRTSTCLRTKWRRSRRTPRACQARGDEMDRCLVERFPSRCRRHHRR